MCASGPTSLTTWIVCFCWNGVNIIWVWVKIKPPGDYRFWSMLPLARVPFGVPIFDPQPFVGSVVATSPGPI